MMERPSDCKCHNAKCDEIDGARIKISLDVYGTPYNTEILPTTIRECEIKKEMCKKAGELIIKQYSYNTRNGLDED